MTTKLFEVKISADGGLLRIDVKVPATVDEGAVDALLTQIFTAFDLVDGKPNIRCREQIMDSLSTGEGEPRRLRLQRSYAEPDYPEKFERVLRGLSSSKPVLH